jgi:hypothetical protein
MYSLCVGVASLSKALNSGTQPGEWVSVGLRCLIIATSDDLGEGVRVCEILGVEGISVGFAAALVGKFGEGIVRHFAVVTIKGEDIEKGFVSEKVGVRDRDGIVIGEGGFALRRGADNANQVAIFPFISISIKATFAKNHLVLVVVFVFFGNRAVFIEFTVDKTFVIEQVGINDFVFSVGIYALVGVGKGCIINGDREVILILITKAIGGEQLAFGGDIDRGWGVTTWLTGNQDE